MNRYGSCPDLDQLGTLQNCTYILTIFELPNCHGNMKNAQKSIILCLIEFISHKIVTFFHYGTSTICIRYWISGTSTRIRIYVYKYRIWNTRQYMSVFSVIWPPLPLSNYRIYLKRQKREMFFRLILSHLF
jgi:hypothetical protein